jgi:hypothetical protein
MLTAQAVDSIRESVEAELGSRSTNLAAAVNACDTEFARAGAFNSSMRIHKRGVIACQELTVRAEIIWGIIQQSRRLFDEPNEVLIADLRQQVKDHITSQAPVVLQLAGRVNDASRQANSIEKPLMECRDQLIRKFSNQVLLFVEDLGREPAASAAGSVTNFYGPVGAVQTGSHAIAHVQIDAAGGARLIEALEKLRDALPRAADMALDDREQGAELVGDVILAARASKPNGLKLTGLLMGLAMLVQTVASVRPAWDAVRAAAHALGIPLP